MNEWFAGSAVPGQCPECGCTSTANAVCGRCWEKVMMNIFKRNLKKEHFQKDQAEFQVLYDLTAIDLHQLANYRSFFFDDHDADFSENLKNSIERLEKLQKSYDKLFRKKRRL